MSNSNTSEWQSLQIQLEELRAVLPTLADLPEVTTENAPEAIARIAETTEQLRRQVLRDRILRDSLQELIGALLRGRDPDATLETLTAYLHQILGVEEILLVRRTVTDRATVYYSGDTSAGHSPRVRHIDEYPWTAESKTLSLADPSRGNTDPPERTDTLDPSFRTLPGHMRPARYRYVLPLVSEADRAAPDGSLIGYLCMNLGAAEGSGFGAEDIARRVAGMLETLRHRQEIERADAFRRQLLSAMQDGVLAFDEAGRTLEVNAAAGQLLGGDRDALANGTIEDLPASARSLTRMLRRALEQKAAGTAREVVLHRGEERRPTHVAMSELRDGTDRFRGIVANLTDLTPVRQMEEEIDRLDRLAALGRFAAGVAHEIRNPLAGIGAGVEYLARRFEEDAPEQTDIQFVLGEVQRLNSIVSDLLDYTHPRPLDRQEIEARHLTERIQTSLKPLAESQKVSLLFEGPARARVYCDPGRIEQVLLNLVRNAIEASPPSGTVRVGWTESSPFRFRVADEGDGLSDEQCRRAFEPFFTTKGTGTGLGLYLSHSIVEQHEGHLILGNGPEGGASIVMELPCLEAERTRDNAVVHFDH